MSIVGATDRWTGKWQQSSPLMQSIPLIFFAQTVARLLAYPSPLPSLLGRSPTYPRLASPKNLATPTHKNETPCPLRSTHWPAPRRLWSPAPPRPSMSPPAPTRLPPSTQPQSSASSTGITRPGPPQGVTRVLAPRTRRHRQTGTTSDVPYRHQTPHAAAMVAEWDYFVAPTRAEPGPRAQPLAELLGVDSGLLGLAVARAAHLIRGHHGIQPCHGRVLQGDAIGAKILMHMGNTAGTGDRKNVRAL